MGFIKTIITMMVIAFIGWFLYTIYLIIGWQWSALSLFLIFCIIFILVEAKNIDRE